jgi:hypothetical protein
MGGAASRGIKTQDIAVIEESKPETDEDGNENELFYATSEEEAQEIKARMAKYEEDKLKRIQAKQLSKKRMREAAEDGMAIKLLKKQLSDMIKSKQLTTEYQKGKFGKKWT